MLRPGNAQLNWLRLERGLQIFPMTGKQLRRQQLHGIVKSASRKGILIALKGQHNGETSQAARPGSCGIPLLAVVSLETRNSFIESFRRRIEINMIELIQRRRHSL